VLGFFEIAVERGRRWRGRIGILILDPKGSFSDIAPAKYSVDNLKIPVILSLAARFFEILMDAL